MAGNVHIQIGELARRSGCNIETIRYCERVGLLPAPRRSAGRYRPYAAADIRRLGFVRRARQLGFTLDQVSALLTLADRSVPDACDEAHQLAARHLTEVRSKIIDPKVIERILADVVARCVASGTQGCPIIDALSANRTMGE